MTKTTLSISLSVLAAIGMTVNANASPVTVSDQANGVLASPLTQTASQDPLVQQAVQWIRSKGTSSQAKLVPTALGSHKDINHSLILGYPETVPM
jgi:hypothetical protein